MRQVWVLLVVLVLHCHGVGQNPSMSLTSQEPPPLTPSLPAPTINNALTPNLPPPSAPAAPPPDQLLRNLLLAMKGSSPSSSSSSFPPSALLRGDASAGIAGGASGTSPKPPSFPSVPAVAGDLKPVAPPHMGEGQVKELVARAQKSLDDEHVMADDMVVIVKKYAASLLSPSSPALTDHETQLLEHFLSATHLPGEGPQQLLHLTSSGTRPLAPSKPLLTGITNVLWLLQACLMLPLLQIPALVQMFIEPTMMVPPPSRQPAPVRPREREDEVFHPYGQYGDYGYEARGYKGYGCASGKCAPWWWTWRKKSPYYPFVGRDA